MTRNVQWRRQCSPTPSDELQLLRSKPPPSIVTSTTGSLTSCLISKRPEPSCTRISKPRCVSWAAEPLGLAAREYRRRATRSWCVAASAPIQPLPDNTRSSDSSNRSSVAAFPVHSTGAYGSLAVATDTVRTRPSPEPLSQLSPSSPPETASVEQTKDNCEQITTGGPTKPQINVPQQFLHISPPSSPQLPVKRKYRRSGIDFIMPSLRSLVSRRTTSGSTSSLAGPTEKTPTIVTEGLRKCETAITLSAASSRTTLLAEPLQATNRLRVPPAAGARSLCSRCSSLLSLASGSRYSLNTAAATFVPVTSSTVPNVLCKLCLADVPHSNTCTLQHCACTFCKDCMQAYVAFEITEGAYDISCPDAQCPAQGVLTINEIERLVELELVEKHKKFRLNREVDIDKSRTWCPRAGCETVCNLCPSEKCLPQSVHCPTCSTDFCSNCKKRWHGGSPCEAEPPGTGIPFDSDLIKCCPMCSVPIEKDEGCAQMMCKRCKHVFCWYCLTSLDDDFLLRHYDKGPCKNKLGHSRASVIWHRTQVIGIFAGFGILLLVASPLLLLAAPCIVCCKCRMCNGTTKLDNDEEIAEESTS